MKDRVLNAERIEDDATVSECICKRIETFTGGPLLQVTQEGCPIHARNLWIEKCEEIRKYQKEFGRSR